MKKILLFVLFGISFVLVIPEYRAATSTRTVNDCYYTDYRGLVECNPEKKNCIGEYITGSCNTVCPLNNLSAKECLDCLASKCETAGIYGSMEAQSSPKTDDDVSKIIEEAIKSALQGIQVLQPSLPDVVTPVPVNPVDPTPDGIPQTQDTLCNPPEGKYCSYCTSDHGTCVRNCIINEAYPQDGQCYSDCYYEGKGYYLDSKTCNECLHTVCDRDLKDEENRLEPSVIDIIDKDNDSEKSTDEWNFCDKHGVLVSMRILNRAFTIAKIIVPIFLIIFGIVDLSKAIMSSDNNAITNATNSLIKMVIIGLLVFFIPTIINAVFSLIDDYTDLEDNGCYTCFFNRDDCDSLIENSNDE